MELPKTGAEYSYWTVVSSEPFSSTPYVGFTRNGYETDKGTVWHLAEWVDPPGTARRLRLLVAGPDCDPLPLGAVRLRSATYNTFIKFNDNPETVIRPGDSLLTVN